MAAAALDGRGGAARAATTDQTAATPSRCGGAHGRRLAHAETHDAAPREPPRARPRESLCRAVLAPRRDRLVRTEGDSGPMWPGPSPAALELSYTKIDQYRRCPRCFYMKYVLELPAPPGPEQVVGIVVHQALEKFYREVRGAEAAGQTRPGRERLLAIGREAFFRSWPRHQEPDRRQLEQALAQLGLALERLDDPRANVVEVEKTIAFAYGPHAMTCKIDRIDQVNTPGGVAFRIVDYKTGRDGKPLREPKADDLQLGMYALALADHYGLGDPAVIPILGMAEYWLLSTGGRGSISLDELDFRAIRGRYIDEAIKWG